MSIYLDNASTTYPKPECVYKAVDKYMRDCGASAGRGNYRRAMDAADTVYRARANVAKLINAENPSRVAFTANATDGINLALKGFLKPGDKVIASNLEHNSVWRPLRKLERDIGIVLKQVHCAPDGTLDLNELRTLASDDTKLIVLLHASNVLGCILPIAEISEIAKTSGAVLMVDAAQTLGIYPVDVQELGIDILAFAGHKGLMGPMGTGGLYIKEGLALDTMKEGGTGSHSSHDTQPLEMPDRFETGTHNIYGLAGLAASTGYILDTGVDTIRKHELELTARMLTGLRKIPGVTVYGGKSTEARVGLTAFNIDGAIPTDAAYYLDDNYGIMVRAGIHCSPQAHSVIGTETDGAIRASLGYFNTIEDIDALISAVTEMAGMPEKIRPVF